MGNHLYTLPCAWTGAARFQLHSDAYDLTHNRAWRWIRWKRRSCNWLGPEWCILLWFSVVLEDIFWRLRGATSTLLAGRTGFGSEVAAEVPIPFSTTSRGLAIQISHHAFDSSHNVARQRLHSIHGSDPIVRFAGPAQWLLQIKTLRTTKSLSSYAVAYCQALGTVPTEG